MKEKKATQQVRENNGNYLTNKESGILGDSHFRGLHLYSLSARKLHFNPQTANFSVVK